MPGDFTFSYVFTRHNPIAPTLEHTAIKMRVQKATADAHYVEWPGSPNKDRWYFKRPDGRALLARGLPQFDSEPGGGASVNVPSSSKRLVPNRPPASLPLKW